MLKQENDDVLKHNGIVILLPGGVLDFHYWFQSCYNDINIKIHSHIVADDISNMLIWYDNNICD